MNGVTEVSAAVAAHQFPDLQRNIHRLARQAWATADGDREDAIKTLSEWLKNDEALMDEAVRFAAGTAVRTAYRAANHRLVKSTEHTDAGSAARRNAELRTVAVHLQTWMNYTMSTGRPLASATREELADEAEMHRSKAVGHTKKFAFFTALHKAAVKSKTVAESMTEDEIAAIAAKVFGGSDGTR